MGPSVAPGGTSAVRCRSSATLKVVGRPPRRTSSAPVKPEPDTVTGVPSGPAAGTNADTCGAASTVNGCGAVALPAGPVTTSGPLVAPAGTVNHRVVSPVGRNSAAAPLTVSETAPVKAAPLRYTRTPGPAAAGETAVMSGGAAWLTVKRSVELPVPPGAVTLTGPLRAPAGTTAETRVSSSTVSSVEATPPKRATVASVKPLPVTTTLAPAGPS